MTEDTKDETRWTYVGRRYVKSGQLRYCFVELSDPEEALYKSDRTFVMFDGVSASAASRSVGWRIDFKKLRKFFQSRSRLIRCEFYCFLSDDRDSSIHKLTDMLAYNGFVVRVARSYDHQESSYRVGSFLSVEIALTMTSPDIRADHFVLFGSDGALVPAVKRAQELGRRVTVIAEQDVVFDGLRRQADNFIDLRFCRDHFALPDTRTAA